MQQVSSQSISVQTAHKLTEMGIRVFPLPTKSKYPFQGDPWKQTATADFNKFMRRIDRIPPNWNLAAVMGPASGIIDVEVDNLIGHQSMDVFRALYGDLNTVSYRARRGCHHWFKWDPVLAEAIPKSKAVCMGVELRLGTDTKGAYSVLPPSHHPEDDVQYSWLPGLSPWETDIKPMPLWLRTAFIASAEQKKAARSMSLEKVGDDFLPGEGMRHDYALQLSTHLYCRMRLPKPLVTNVVKLLYDATDKKGEEAERDAEILVSSLRRPQSDEDMLAELNWQELDNTADVLVRDMKAKKRMMEARATCPAVFPDLIEKMGDLARESQIPRNLFLANTLAAVSAAVGASVTVQYAPEAPPSGLQIYTMGCGPSGCGKSLSLKTPLKPLVGTKAFCTDATPEALMAQLARNPRGVLVQLAEGKQFSSMLSRYRQPQDGGSNNSLFCEAWSGDTIVSVRQDEKKSIRIERPYLTIAATIQDYNLRTLSIDDIMEGLLQRVIIVGADPVPDEAALGAVTALQALYPEYKEALERLMTLRPHVYDSIMEASCQDIKTLIRNCRPIAAVLDKEAYAVWKDYQKWKRSSALQDQFPESHPFRADLHRHAELVLRIACLLYLIEAALDKLRWEQMNLEGSIFTLIPCRYVEAAISFMEWAWNEKRIIADEVVEEKFLKACPTGLTREFGSIPEMLRRLASRRYRKLKHRLHEGEEIWTARDYYRHLRLTADDAQAEIDQFMAQGMVVVMQESAPMKYRFVPERLIAQSRDRR